jgi:hypothetical protein
MFFGSNWSKLVKVGQNPRLGQFACLPFGASALLRNSDFGFHVRRDFKPARKIKIMIKKGKSPTPPPSTPVQTVNPSGPR